MKKFLLSMLGMAAIVSANASSGPVLSTIWEDDRYDLVSIESVNHNTPIAVTAAGDVYATGVFTDAFEFAGSELTPIAESSYILKYAADGTEVWGVAIAGAATVTSVAADADGKLYVAGTFADVVSFGSTDDKAVEKEGMKASDGSYYEKQNSSFIAIYNADGTIAGVDTFVPTYHPSLADMVDLLYYPSDGDVFFHINKIAVDGGKVYCSADFTGSITKGDASFVGGTYDMEGWGFYYMDIEAGAVFSINSDFSGCNVLASVKLTTDFDPVAGVGVLSSSFTVAEDAVYAAFTCMNDVTLTIGTETKDCSYAKIDDDGYVEVGYIVAAVDKTTGASKAIKEFTTKTSSTTVNDIVSDMQMSGNNVVVIGTFQNTLPFDADITAVGDNDVFVSTLDTTLGVVMNATSGVAEESNKKEVAISTAVYHNSLWVNTTIGGNYGGVDAVNSYMVELSQNPSFETISPVVNAVAVNGSYVALAATAVSDNVANVFALFKDELSAICNVEIDTDSNLPVKYYNLQGVEVVGENLPAGLYISKQGEKTEKIIVK